jgi:hypothetical protein
MQMHKRERIDFQLKIANSWRCILFLKKIWCRSPANFLSCMTFSDVSDVRSNGGHREASIGSGSSIFPRATLFHSHLIGSVCVLSYFDCV